MKNLLIDRLASEVRTVELMSHMREFARWIKLSGTPEEEKAFRYIDKKLTSYGFRTQTILHDAYISLPGDASIEIDGRIIACITHSHARPSAQGGTNGDVIYVGECGPADIEGRDLKGRILLIDGMAVPQAAYLASRAGAIGQIHITPDDYLHEMCVSPIWGSPSVETLDRLPSTVITTISRADGAELRDRLSRGERVSATLHAQVDTGWRQTPILVADLDGPNGAADPFVLFAAHVDTWHYGVMDNGGANATMLEVARICAQHSDSWRRGIRLCFWSGHSHGRYSGSTWYADQNWAELERRCALHVNIDSTGGRGATIVSNTGAAPELRQFASDIIAAETGQSFAGRRVGRQGDQSFWGIGVPTMFGSLSHQPRPEGHQGHHLHLGWWWHTPGDTLDNIDEAILARDTRIYLRTVWRLLTDPVLPFDYGTHLDDLATELGAIAPRLAEDCPVDALIEETARLREAISTMMAHAADADAVQAERLNRALMAISRSLVPVESSTGDRFGHDPALSQPAWPALQPLRALSKTQVNSDEACFSVVSAVRARNRVAYALREAKAVCERFMANKT
ncbi:M28 family peptidase [Bosea minatitlanensis]|uniref:M28 family peptidase n=1 Tax=Bosea minatitlanensis TaxID=128782 RepID=A0ABW0F1B6_9HYPH|nr:M28 family peptidase [Bosea minatitlanensis]MCT4494165.1 M28 family peptidase [Bosea minatitlanensis]